MQKILLDAGKACEKFHNKNVRAITGVRKIQCDELWQFIYHKERSIEWADLWDIGGDVRTFTAIDADSKLLVSYFVRKYRNTPSAVRLFNDVKERHVTTPLLFTDGLPAYGEAADIVFPRKENLTQSRHFEDTEHSDRACRKTRSLNPREQSSIESEKRLRLANGTSTTLRCYICSPFTTTGFEIIRRYRFHQPLKLDSAIRFMLWTSSSSSLAILSHDRRNLDLLSAQNIGSVRNNRYTSISKRRPLALWDARGL